MGSFVFWQRWLFISFVLFALAGMITALIPDSVLFSSYYKNISQILFHRSKLPEQVITFKNFIAGPLGGTVAGFYILAAFVAAGPFKKKEKWSRDAIVISFLAWFLIDSSICIYHQMYFQVYILNCFSFIIKAIPILMTWHHFKSAGT